ncbi:hypothetical protein EYF80_046126 [Liparis tanakae]|uniref:Uncharacterized protein n=1 Tax=Liparis tanakae TaxID=230148 RepID=A0A4Z2FSD9_9TELE|nr:hypothetical protein EYF80_046126 [Liparis tanakae]
MEGNKRIDGTAREVKRGGGSRNGNAAAAQRDGNTELFVAPKYGGRLRVHERRDSCSSVTRVVTPGHKSFKMKGSRVEHAAHLTLLKCRLAF